MSNLELVKEVRNRSQVSLNECKKALDEANGDVEAALILIQKKGLQKAVERASRIATEGLVSSYIHNGRVGVLTEVNCETDFVARSQDFIDFCEAVNLQIASMNPQYVSLLEIPNAHTRSQADIFAVQMRDGGAKIKPEQWDRVLEGKVLKWQKEISLMQQESVLHPGKTLEDLRTSLVSKMGENVTVRRFTRWEVGQGLEKAPVKDYAQEVSELSGVKQVSAVYQDRQVVIPDGPK